MDKVSITLNVFFIITTCLAVWLFYRAANHSKTFLIMAIIWMAIQWLIGRTNFYDNQTAVPPRFVLLIAPPFGLMLLMFFTTSGKKFINSLQIKHLTLIHTIRIPVEITLYYLFLYKVIPQIMTFEGRNMDIIAGVTAPIIYYICFVKQKLSNTFLILWNILGMLLLVNIITIAILSAKTPFQQFAFDQPNIAVGHFPFNWLPSVIVPLVLFAHLSSVWQMIRQKRTSEIHVH